MFPSLAAAALSAAAAARTTSSNLSVAGSDAYGAAPLSKEAALLESNCSALREKLVGCMRDIADCFDTKKNLYLGQLKKIREISNMATRNAIQVTPEALHTACCNRLVAVLLPLLI